MHDHVGLEGLLLDEGLEAHVALEGPDAAVDQHVPLQVGRQRELTSAHVALEALTTLEGERERKRNVQRLFNQRKLVPGAQLVKQGTNDTKVMDLLPGEHTC